MRAKGKKGAAAPQRIVTAIGTAAHARDPELGKKIEEAMHQAAIQALAEGITDPEEIKARKLAAREEARKP
jgi:hypothetical protein